MNYILFNNQILISDESRVHPVTKGAELKGALGAVEKARICVVDVDVLIAASVEIPVEKKDSILVRKFKEFYQQDAYLIQDERIDNNLFQVIGIKEQRAREVYALIPPEKVEALIPYAVALRDALMNQAVDFNKTIVFVDDLGNERLLTVFDGLKFSRTRVIVNNGEDILPEIKRSQIDFFKKNEEFISKKGSDFVILVNDKELAALISKNAEGLKAEYLDLAYPALDGLRRTGTLINYRLPEEYVRIKKEVELRSRILALTYSLVFVAIGFLYFFVNGIELRAMNGKYVKARQVYEMLDEQLYRLDQRTYREDLRLSRPVNFGVAYLELSGIIPTSYTVNSFRIYKTDRWNMEMTLFVDHDGLFVPIPRKKILKNAMIKDIFVNNQPCKQLQVSL